MGSVELTRVVVAVADNVHEQQRSQEGSKQHPTYSCPNDGRVRVVSWFRCNTSQLLIVKERTEELCYLCYQGCGSHPM